MRRHDPQPKVKQMSNLSKQDKPQNMRKELVMHIATLDLYKDVSWLRTDVHKLLSMVKIVKAGDTYTINYRQSELDRITGYVRDIQALLEDVKVDVYEIERLNKLQGDTDV